MDEPVPLRRSLALLWKACVAGRRLCCEKRALYPTIAGAVAKLQLKKTEKTNAANGVNFWEFKDFIQNENEKNIDHEIKIGLAQKFQNVIG